MTTLYIINGMDLSEDEVLGISDDVFGGFVGLEDYGWDVEKFVRDKLRLQSHEASSKLDQINL